LGAISVPSVLIIGGGAAGLAAAQRLARADIRVTILEARDRLGGRIYTLRDHRLPIPVELGAEFVHGKPSEIWDIVRGTNLMMGSLDGDDWCSENHVLKKCNDFWPRWEEVARALKRGKSYPDRPFSEFLETLEIEQKTKTVAMEFVEGFNACRGNLISLQHLSISQEAADRIGGGIPYRILSGYDRLVGILSELDAARVEIHLNTIVGEIAWRAGHARANHFEADQAIITLPLGLLRAGAVRFVPELEAKKAAAQEMIMGQVVKVILCFDSPFWEERGITNLSFIHARGQPFPTWWTTRPVAAPILIGWAGGPPAEKLSFSSEDAIRGTAIRSLANALKMNSGRLERRITASFVYDWQADPFSLGAYSYIPAGAITAPLRLAEPVANTLFFAGEATNSDGHSGTVHGAIATGYRAADEILTVTSRGTA